MSHPSGKTLLLAALLLYIALPVFGQSAMTVRHEVHHDISLPLREMIKSAPKLAASKHEAEPVRMIPLPPGSAPLAEDPVLQRTVGPNTPTVGISFEGLGNGQFGFFPNAAPPDTNGAVGATQYVQWVNESFAVFNKSTGALVAGPTAGNTLWAGFGGGCQNNNDGDPIAIYDKVANRWIMSQFSVSTTPFLQCIAVSTTSDATGTYNRYSFQYNNFDDYPKMGVWPDAYYETFNMFQGNTFVGSDACAYDRNAMLAGHAATQICFQQGNSVGGLLPADLDGTTLPPTGSPNYMIFFSTNSLKLFRFHVDFAIPGNSTFTGPTTISVAAFSPLCSGAFGLTCVPQPGTTTKLDSLADRLMYRLAYRNFGTHESLVLNHSVTANSGGGIRWYEIQNPSGTPSLAQQATFAPDSNFRWMGSIAMDQAGNLAVGYSVSNGSSVHPSVAYAGRLASDPSGTLGAEVNVVTGTGSQTSGLTRWGDYSAMTVDPVDDCTFWYTQEYMKTTGSFNWNTRIANFKFPGCGGGGGTPAVTLSPTSLKFAATVLRTTSAGKKVTLTNTGTATLNISNITTSGDFHINSKTCGTTVAVSASCTVTVSFTPTLIGNRTGSLTFTDNAPNNPQSVPLSGTGVSISFIPKSTNYGTVTVGNTSSKNITVTNVGTGTVTFTGFSLVGLNPGDFHITANTCGGTLAGGGNCVVTVQFKPTATGTRKGTLKVTDSGAGTASQTSALAGVGG
jgi:Abnormal spindle-like microcephaly-assoc'd, ASPM-SPD-2-Hydin/Cep192 domain 4